MDTLRHARIEGRSALQTPVIHLRHRDGRTGTLVLTAHLGDAHYFETLRKLIAASGATVFFESIRARDDSPEHWREKYHRLLFRLRTEVYHDVSSLGIFAFQGDALAPEPSWVSADIDCCQFASALRAAGVRTFQYDLAITMLRGIVRKAKAGNREAARTIEMMMKSGLILVSLPLVFDALKLLPNSRSFQSVANDQRNAVAVRTVLDAKPESFVLVYGAAHGPGLLSLLRKAGYEETGREWYSVFTL
jgi:hypothetical protein